MWWTLLNVCVGKSVNTEKQQQQQKTFLTMACFFLGKPKQNVFLAGPEMVKSFKCRQDFGAACLTSEIQPMALAATTSDKSLETLLSQPPVWLWCLAWQLSTFLVRSDCLPSRPPHANPSKCQTSQIKIK